MLHRHEARGGGLGRNQAQHVQAVGQGGGIKPYFSQNAGWFDGALGYDVALVVVEHGLPGLVRAREANRELLLGRNGKDADFGRNEGVGVAVAGIGVGWAGLVCGRSGRLWPLQNQTQSEFKLLLLNNINKNIFKE